MEEEPERGEVRLGTIWEEMLMLAVQDMTAIVSEGGWSKNEEGESHYARDSRKKRERAAKKNRASARKWIGAKTERGALSFGRCCEVVGLNAEAVRRALLKREIR